MEHSNQVREFRLTQQGIELIDVYLGDGTVLTGAARAIQEANEKAASLMRQQEFERKRRALVQKKAIAQSQITALQAQIEAEEDELEVIDIYQQPGVSKQEHIVAVPTLIKRLPLPLQKVIGDMSKTEKVLVGLDLIPKMTEK